MPSEPLVPVPADDLRQLVVMAHRYLAAVPDELLELDGWDADAARVAIVRCQALLELE